jgi:D-alanyl-lipoteichoic acid acyltransferase DltB (MBOAT superfamily)
MLFNSLDFVVFLAVVYPLYFALRRRQRAVLLLASLFFYGYWSPPYLLLILASVAVDFVAAQRIHASRGSTRRLWLTASVVANLGILATFKYEGFFAANAAAVFGALGLDWAPPQLTLLLPMGISFYTFQSMAYSIDVYRGRFRPLTRFRDVLLFVSFFPQLVAGPIMRPSDLVPQFRDDVRLDPQALAEGLSRMGKGLVKKLLFADTLGAYVNLVFADPGQFDAGQILLAVYAFAIQIYCDFSGYTDIAIGLGRTLGYSIPENFAHPYHARSITEFWRRWHISLSSWLRDYLYIPLGGNRRGPSRTYVNLLITMAIGGLWHGAAWTFVIWGVLHGVLLAVERRLGLRDALSPPALGGLLRGLITFHLVCLGWVFFRAANLADAGLILQTLANGGWQIDSLNGYMSTLVVVFVVLHELERRWPLARFAHTRGGLAVGMAALAASLAMMLNRVPAEFIYFQF